MGAWFALPCSRRGSKRGATRQRMTAAAADGAKARQRLPGRKAPPPRRPPGGGGKYTDPLTHLTAAPANRKKSLSKKSKPPTQKSDLSNMATYGYIRVSSAGQMDGTSPEEQKRKIIGCRLKSPHFAGRFHPAADDPAGVLRAAPSPRLPRPLAGDGQRAARHLARQPLDAALDRLRAEQRGHANEL